MYIHFNITFPHTLCPPPNVHQNYYTMLTPSVRVTGLRYYTKLRKAGRQTTHTVGAVGWLSLSVVNGIHLENPNSPKPESNKSKRKILNTINPYPTAFPYGNGMVLHFYQQQESSTTKTVHKVINKGLKTYV